MSRFIEDHAFILSIAVAVLGVAVFIIAGDMLFGYSDADTGRYSETRRN